MNQDNWEIQFGYYKEVRSMTPNTNDAEDELNAAQVREFVDKFERLVKEKNTALLDEETVEVAVDFYFNKGDITKAKKACTVGLSLYPNSLVLIIVQVQLFMADNKLRLAFDLIERGFLFFPNDPELTILKGVLLNLEGKFPEAILVFEEILPNAEDKGFIYFHLGEAYQSWGKTTKALDCYKQAMREGLENPFVFSEIMYCFALIDEPAQTMIDFLNTLIDKNPYSAYAWFHLGQTYAMEDRQEEAINAYLYVLAIDDRHTAAKFHLGHAYMNIGKYEDALYYYKETLKEDENSPNTLTHVAAANEKLELWTEARKYYLKATEISADWHEAWYGLASIMFEQGKWAETIHFVKKAIAINNVEDSYFELLAEAEANIGHVEASSEAYRKAIELAPTTVDYWLNWSMIYYEEQEYETAFHIIEDAILEVPNEADLYYRAAVYLLKLGRMKEAVSHLEIAYSLEPDTHTQIYAFFPDIEIQKNLFKLIQMIK